MDPSWRRLEYEAINTHKVLNPTHVAKHWSHVSEKDLMECGFLTNAKIHRTTRSSFQEYGLDGLAIDQDTYHAIQVKHYSTNVGSKELGTFYEVLFLRMRMKNNQSKGYIYTSGDITTGLKECIKNSTGILSHSIVKHHENVESEEELRLRPYQEDALSALDEFDTNCLAVINLPCGCGKTTIAWHHLAQCEYNLIICIAPLRVSVDNLKKTIILDEYKVLVVDSDPGGTTDEKEIESFLLTQEKKIIFSTFDSARDILSKYTSFITENSYILVDEVHNLVSKPKLCDFVNKFNQGLLMSATVPEELYEAVNCELAYQYTISEAITNKYVCDYQVWLPNIEDTQIPIELVDIKNDLLSKVLFLVHGMLYTGSKRCIVYCTSQQECDNFNDIFQTVCELYHHINCWTAKITGTITAKQRRKTLREFQTDKEDLQTLHIITSVRILDEAVDIARCDSIFRTFVGQYSDDIRMVQQACRGCRIDGMNEHKVNNIFIWTDDWNKAVNIFSLLKEMDINFSKKLNILGTNYDTFTESKQRKRNKKTQKELKEFVQVKCITSHDKFVERVMKIAEYQKEYGKLPTSGSRGLRTRLKTNKEKHQILVAHYLYKFRSMFVHKILTETQVEFLDSNVMDWRPVSFEAHQRNRIVELSKWITAHKGEFPHRNKNDSQESRLAMFLTNLTQRYKIGKIHQTNIDFLNRLIPNWMPISLFEHHMKRIHELILWYENHSNKLPKQLHKKHNQTLENEEENKQASYLNKLRKLFSRNDPVLHLQHINLLDAKIPNWRSIDLVEYHTNRVYELINFHVKYGHLPHCHIIPQTPEEIAEDKLGMYLANIKKMAKKNKVEQKIIFLLNDNIPEWNDSSQEIHIRKINEVVKFQLEHGHLPIHLKYIKNENDKYEKTLATYLTTLRMTHKANKLNVQILGYLNEKLPNWFSRKI